MRLDESPLQPLFHLGTNVTITKRQIIRNGFTYLFIKRAMVGNSCLVTCLRNYLTEVILSPVITWLLRIFSASAFCLIFSGDKVFSLLSGGVSFLKSYSEVKVLTKMYVMA